MPTKLVMWRVFCDFLIEIQFLILLLVIITALAGLRGGGGWNPSTPCRWYPSMPCRSPRGSPGPDPWRKLRGLTRGVSRPTPRGVVSQNALRQTPHPMDGYCRRRYASYWNAFLLKMIPPIRPIMTSCENNHKGVVTTATVETIQTDSSDLQVFDRIDEMNTNHSQYRKSTIERVHPWSWEKRFGGGGPWFDNVLYRVARPKTAWKWKPLDREGDCASLQPPIRQRRQVIAKYVFNIFTP